MLVFAFDTSLSSCSVAIIEGSKTLWTRTKHSVVGQAEELPKMAAEALSSTAITAKELDLVGVTTGPGTFAGIRVGVAFARAMTLGVKAQSVGVSTLTAIAAGAAHDNDFIAPIIDARRGQVYTALLTADLKPIIPPFVTPTGECLARLEAETGGRELTIVGPGAHLLAPGFLDIAPDISIDPAIVARLAITATQPYSMPAPLYLRPPDAKPSRQLQSPSDG